MDMLFSGRLTHGAHTLTSGLTGNRYSAQREFALKHMPEDHLFKIVSTIYEVSVPHPLEYRITPAR